MVGGIWHRRNFQSVILAVAATLANLWYAITGKSKRFPLLDVGGGGRCLLLEPLSTPSLGNLTFSQQMQQWHETCLGIGFPPIIARFGGAVKLFGGSFKEPTHVVGVFCLRKLAVALAVEGQS